MAFQVRKRGRLTSYRADNRSVLPALEAEVDGVLTIYFPGLTGGWSAMGVLRRDELVAMDPHRPIPLVFAYRETWLPDAGSTGSPRETAFNEARAVGCPPKVSESCSTRPSHRAPAGARCSW